jgi:hypothetical protein
MFMWKQLAQRTVATGLWQYGQFLACSSTSPPHDGQR